MVEEHPFPYYIPEHANKLIIGSFPCYNGTDHGDWFYTGSGKSFFWKLLSDVFDMPYQSKEDKIAISVKHKIGFTDIASKIERMKGNCSDTNLKIIEVNANGINACLKANIETIFFTSKFVERYFIKNFPDVNLPSFVLLSPSPAANLHIAGLEEYKALTKTNRITSPYDYRLLKYQMHLLKE